MPPYKAYITHPVGYVVPGVNFDEVKGRERQEVLTYSAELMKPYLKALDLSLYVEGVRTYTQFLVVEDPENPVASILIFLKDDMAAMSLQEKISRNFDPGTKVTIRPLSDKGLAPFPSEQYGGP